MTVEELSDEKAKAEREIESILYTFTAKTGAEIRMISGSASENGGIGGGDHWEAWCRITLDI